MKRHHETGNTMTIRAIAAAALFLLSAQMASADPMKCSGENKTASPLAGKSAHPASQTVRGKLPRQPSQLRTHRLLGQRRGALLRFDEAVVEKQTAAPRAAPPLKYSSPTLADDFELGRSLRRQSRRLHSTGAWAADGAATGLSRRPRHAFEQRVLLDGQRLVEDFAIDHRGALQLDVVAG